MGRAPIGCRASEAEEEVAVRKGAWTADEDEKLVSFIKKNKGHGSWRTLPKLAGLERCGKSCRLRWTNYLRPNIRRGSFSAEEEQMIMQLHAVVGNKWSSIASHLPGRTDNEVKNHWNTHIKKKLSKMGIDPVTHLPLNLILSHHLQLHNTQLSATSSNQSDINSDLQKALLLQQSLQLNPTIASHLVQWELARIEAQARQNLARAHELPYIQNYYASWLQSWLHQSQAHSYDLNALQLQAGNSWPEALMTSNPLISNSSIMLPHKLPNHAECQINLFKDLYPSSNCTGNSDTSPSTSTLNKGCLPSKCNEGIEQFLEEHASPSSTSNISMPSPDTCSSNNSLSSHLPPTHFMLPNDLLDLDPSPNKRCNPFTNADSHKSSPVLVDESDAPQCHDSYWMRMLNLVGQATLENL